MRRHWEMREGILLQSIPYLENRRILKIFTKEAGLLPLIASAKKAPFAIPFIKAEWVYRTTQTELHSLKDAALLDPFLTLKDTFSTLQAAGSIASDLLRSQLPNKASPALYDLLLASLAHIPLNPPAIAQAFRLKLLQCEGLLHLPCEAPHPFTLEEWDLALHLGLARRFSELASLAIPAPFAKKTNDFFLAAVR